MPRSLSQTLAGQAEGTVFQEEAWTPFQELVILYELLHQRRSLPIKPASVSPPLLTKK